MAYICYKPKGSCEKCRHYRADENGRMICYAMTDTLTANEIHEAIERYKAGKTGYKPPITMDIFYENPIDKFAKQMTENQDHFIYKQIMAVSNVKVDEPELMRALAYDRGQYDAGYRDGWEARGEKIIRCRDCKHYKCDTIFSFQDWNCDNDNGLANCKPTDYCSRAERKDENE